MRNIFNKMIESFKNTAEKSFEYLYEHLKKDTSKMLVYTGAIGFFLSSVAQVIGLVVNSKISSDQKGFLIPQEIYDGLINIATFLTITMGTKMLLSKLMSTGKIVPKDVKEHLMNNKIFKEQIGKFDFNVADALKNNKELLNSYNAFYDLTNTKATIATGALATGIITPIIRNRKAAVAQQDYFDNKDKYTQMAMQYKGDMRI